MNHPSEWARYFDENTGSYRYKHKGSGVIRDTFMTIGKVFKKIRKLPKKRVRNENRCLRVQKRNLKIFCKTKYQ